MKQSEIFVSDIHWPFHDKAAWNITLKIIQYRQPDRVHIGGDAVDFHSISRHPKAMADRTLLKYELDESRRELRRLRVAAPGSEMAYQAGNHDMRMQIFLRDRAPELSALGELDLPVLLDLETLGIDWIGEQEKFKVGKLWHHHGHLIAGGGKNPAKAKFANVFQNIIFGHHHTFDYHSVRQYGTGQLLQSVSNGCLYTLSPEYAHAPHWHIGFTMVDYVDGGDFSVRQVHINKREDGSSFAIVDGYVFESTDDEDIDRYLAVANTKARKRGAK